MKKFLFIIIALFAIINSKAQITRSQSDFGNIYFHAIQANSV